MIGNDLKAERLWGRECSRPCAGNLSTYNMADIEPEFDIEKDLPDFLFSVLSRTNVITSKDETTIDDLQEQFLVLDRTVSLLRSIALTDNGQDREEWESLAEAFSEVLQAVEYRLKTVPGKRSSETQLECQVLRAGNPGRPKFLIPAETLEDLRGLGFSWEKISRMFGVSRWTIYRRVQSYGLKNVAQFSSLPDAQLDQLVLDYLNRHGRTTGRTYLAGYLMSLGLRVQRRRVRESLTRVDPVNTALRWGIVVSRRKYSVPWPNSLWHLDGHHSLIRWGLVIHGCIDGFSRRIVFLRCSDNNLSQTVLELFLKAIEKDGFWPSRIRVDYWVENLLVCDAMVEGRGEGRGSFIPGPSTRNQRIERLWREVFRCVCHLFYYVFYAMEDTGLLQIDNPVDVTALHLIFVPRINEALSEFMEAFNHHQLRTEHHWSPHQMWINGMLNELNPLARGQLDDVLQDLEYYGIDPDGPSPFENSNNDVVVPTVALPVNHQSITSIVLERIDPLMPSTQMGLDIYTSIRQIVKDSIEGIL